MQEFGDKFEEYMLEWLPTLVGEGTDPTNYVVTFDDHLHGFDVEDPTEPFPFVVATMRSTTTQNQGEIGEAHDLRTWEMHIYYIDITDDYKAGKAKRSNIMSTIQMYIETNMTFGGFRVTSTLEDHNATEYVYDTTVSTIMYDYSGQEDYHTFTSEMYLTIYTAKTQGS